jgi:hypothetical protein
MIQDTIENDIKLEIKFDFDEQVENEAIVDKDYEKTFGRLYKTFDVRFIKRKLLESYNEVLLQ